MSVQTDIDAAMQDASRTVIGLVKDVVVTNPITTPAASIARGRGYQITSGVSQGIAGGDFGIDPNQLTIFATGLLAEPRKGYEISFDGKTFSVDGAVRYPGSTSAYTIDMTRTSR